ncbi:MAG: hypothetical protein HUK15_04725, partial [Bacteroidales bacterium]|nr:hypothetical protein [Bacteroidales bacterium]
EIFSESIKQVKKLQIDKITLETLVLSKLKGSGYEYRIEYAKTKAVLFVKSGSYQISIDITYSKMIEIVKDLPELLRNAINMLNQLPKNVKISQTDKKRVEWKTM